MSSPALGLFNPESEIPRDQPEPEPIPATGSGRRSRAKQAKALRLAPFAMEHVDARNNDLSVRLRMMQVFLEGYCGEKCYCWPGNKELSLAYGCSINTVQEILLELDQLDVIRRPEGVDEKGRPNRLGIILLKRLNPNLPVADPKQLAEVEELLKRDIAQSREKLARTLKSGCSPAPRNPGAPNPREPAGPAPRKPGPGRTRKSGHGIDGGALKEPPTSNVNVGPAPAPEGRAAGPNDRKEDAGPTGTQEPTDQAEAPNREANDEGAMSQTASVTASGPDPARTPGGEPAEAEPIPTPEEFAGYWELFEAGIEKGFRLDRPPNPVDIQDREAYAIYNKWRLAKNAWARIKANPAHHAAAVLWSESTGKPLPDVPPAPPLQPLPRIFTAPQVEAAKPVNPEPAKKPAEKKLNRMPPPAPPVKDKAGTLALIAKLAEDKSPEATERVAERMCEDFRDTNAQSRVTFRNMAMSAQEGGTPIEMLLGAFDEACREKVFNRGKSFIGAMKRLRREWREQASEDSMEASRR